MNDFLKDKNFGQILLSSPQPGEDDKARNKRLYQDGLFIQKMAELYIKWNSSKEQAEVKEAAPTLQLVPPSLVPPSKDSIPDEMA
jgi:hypothetical protein